MTAQTVCITKEKYERLQEMTQIDWELVDKVRRSFEDAKCGRIRRVA